MKLDTMGFKKIRENTNQSDGLCGQNEVKPWTRNQRNCLQPGTAEVAAAQYNLCGAYKREAPETSQNAHREAVAPSIQRR